MSGFKDTKLNDILFFDIFDSIANIILVCSEKMCNDYIGLCKKIENHEEKIRNELYENYLDNDDVRTEVGFDSIPLRFIIESPENYNLNSCTYSGRVDIKVVGKNWLTSDRKDYFIIECKRIDGSADLNKKFIENGVCRFVSEPILYPSYHKKNFMFGFVVKNIDVKGNALLLNTLQNTDTKISVNEAFTETECKINKAYTYVSKYFVKQGSIEIKHLFFNFSEVIT